MNRSYVISVLPLPRLLYSQLSFTHVICVVIGLREVGWRSKTTALSAGLLSPSEHLRSINFLQDNRSFMIRSICFNGRYLPHNGSLLLVLGLLRIHWAVSSLISFSIVHYYLGLCLLCIFLRFPLINTHVILDLGALLLKHDIFLLFDLFTHNLWFTSCLRDGSRGTTTLSV